MTEDLKILQAIPGYQQAPEFHKIVQFIGEGHFRKMKWEQWQAVYKSPYNGPSSPSGN